MSTPNSMNSTADFISWLWGYAHRYKGYLAISTLAMFFFSFTNTGFIIYGAHEISRQLEQGTLSEHFTLKIPEVPFLFPNGYEWVVASGNTETILYTGLLLAVPLILIRTISDFIRLFGMKYVSICISRDIRDELYENMINRPVTYFEQQNVGDLISRLSSDINSVQSAVNVGVRDLIQAPIEFLMAIGLVAYYAPYLSLFLLIIPVCGYLIYYVGEKIKRYSRASQDVMGDLLSRIQQRFSGIKLVKSSARESKEIENFNEENQKHFRKTRRHIFSDSLLRPMMHLLIYMLALVVVFVGIKLIISGYQTKTSMVTFIVSLPWLYKSINKFSNINKKIQTARGAAERIEQIFSESDDIFSDLQEGEREAEFEDEIVFNNVTYRYPGYQEEAIRDVNLTIPKGENLAIVGPSGAGKSTFTDLLLRFFDPTEGTIYLDGRPLEEYTVDSYRRLFGLVTQHTFLFDQSIRENIRYGREDINETQVRRAADQAEALQFIERLDEGFDTNIGEKGVRLSGGERQRLSLARALANQPEILVLDEATSNVDSQSEKMILKAINNLPGHMTLVSISHALATVQFAERIIVLNDHSVEAIGSHEMLLEKSSTYRELYEHQIDEIEAAFS